MPPVTSGLVPVGDDAVQPPTPEPPFEGAPGASGSWAAAAPLGAMPLGAMPFGSVPYSAGAKSRMMHGRLLDSEPHHDSHPSADEEGHEGAAGHDLGRAMPKESKAEDEEGNAVRLAKEGAQRTRSWAQARGRGAHAVELAARHLASRMLRRTPSTSTAAASSSTVSSTSPPAHLMGWPVLPSFDSHQDKAAVSKKASASSTTTTSTTTTTARPSAAQYRRQSGPSTRSFG